MYVTKGISEVHKALGFDFLKCDTGDAFDQNFSTEAMWGKG